MGHQKLVPHLAQLAIGFTGPWRGPPQAQVKLTKRCPGLWMAHCWVHQSLPPKGEPRTLAELDEMRAEDEEKRHALPEAFRDPVPHDARAVTFLYWSMYPNNGRVEELFSATVWENSNSDDPCLEHYEGEELAGRLIELELAGPYLRTSLSPIEDWYEPKVPADEDTSGAFYVHPPMDAAESDKPEARQRRRGTIWIADTKDWSRSCSNPPKPLVYPFDNWRSRQVAYQRAMVSVADVDPYGTCYIHTYFH